MAVVMNELNPTLLDWKAALDPNGQVAALIEVLHETNEVLEDMAVIEGNEATSHLMNIRTGLPPVTWRRLYEGIDPGKGAREQVRETTGWLEAYNQIDAKLVALHGAGQAFRMQEADGQIEAMAQEVARRIFVGNTADDPKHIMGLSPRYNEGRKSVAQNARNVLNGGGTGADNRSIWLLSWGPMGCFTFTPKGMPAGLQMEDKGRVTSETAGGTGKLLEVFRARFEWNLGLGLADWRYCVRIANIDLSQLNEDASGNSANLPILMARAIRKVPKRQMMRMAFYMSDEMYDYLGPQLSAAVKESTLTMDHVGGRTITRFQGIPCRQVDQLAMDEARVPF